MVTAVIRFQSSILRPVRPHIFPIARHFNSTAASPSHPIEAAHCRHHGFAAAGDDGVCGGIAGREASKAVFEKISLSGGPPQMAHRVKGIVMRDGSIIGGFARVMDDTSVKLVTVGVKSRFPGARWRGLCFSADE